VRAALRSASITAPVSSNSDVASALLQAREDAGPDDKILVFGSFYTVAAALRAMNHD
jgi:folylpolyglutamate synthase/dihydropteroate synthase